MNYLPEEDVWVPDVHLMDISDPVQGGDGGADNMQGRAYASRTLWLKNRIGNVGALLPAAA
jgi:hypothetical protein